MYVGIAHSNQARHVKKQNKKKKRDPHRDCECYSFPLFKRRAREDHFPVKSMSFVVFFHLVAGSL